MITKAPAWRTPTLDNDNTPTVSWDFKEADTINPVVADPLSIQSSQNHHHRLSPSVFYHHGYLNNMADDASHWFDISPHRFLALFHYIYNPQYPSLLQLCHPPT